MSKIVLMTALITLNIFIFFESSTEAVELRHVIASGDNSDSWQSQRHCYKVYGDSKRLLCLPTSTYKVVTGQIGFDSGFNSNEDAFITASKVSNRSIDREFLESLFEKNNFLSFSGITRLSAVYGETTFALVPYYFAAGFKISNPSLPEVNFAAISSSHLFISHNFIHNFSKTYQLVAMPGFTIGSKDAKTGDFDVLELAAKKSEEVIISEKWVERAGSVAISLLSKQPYFPTLSIRANQITSSDPCQACRSGGITIAEEIAPHVAASLGGFAPVGFGLLWIGATGKYNGLSKTFNDKASGLSALYKIGFLDSFFSIAPSIVSFGFMFDANLYRIGIQYTDEKQSNELQIARKKHSYIHLGFKI
jgi:hypothetical protein